MITTLRLTLWALSATIALTGAAWARPMLDPPVRYAVKPRDTLFDLSRRFLVSPSAYRQLVGPNRILDPRRLQPGKLLVIPVRLLRTEPIRAEVVAFSGPVTVDGVPARTGAVVAQGSVISTGASAFVTLELPDETRLTVPSQSRVRIERLRHVLLTDSLDRVFTVQQGRSESVVTPMTNPASRYLINTPIASAAVRGTVFRVTFNSGAASGSVEVLKGAVGVTAGTSAGEVATAQAFGVQIGANGVSAPARLLPEPRLDHAGRDQNEPGLTFTFLPLSGAAGYRLQLANDAGFVDIIRETLAEGLTATFDELADGTYFVRATAIDGGGLEGLPAVYSFTRELSTLEGAAGRSGDRKMRRYLFKWRTSGAGAKTFRFQLFDHPGGDRPMIDEPGLNQSAVELTDLPDGEYYWRVVVSTFSKGRYIEKIGDLQKLQIGQ